MKQAIAAGVITISLHIPGAESVERVFVNSGSVIEFVHNSGGRSFFIVNGRIEKEYEEERRIDRMRSAISEMMKRTRWAPSSNPLDWFNAFRPPTVEGALRERLAARSAPRRAFLPGSLAERRKAKRRAFVQGLAA